ncbi:hypothetical protein BF49_6564 [Bradyrhizobium sp.]|nr:hypothetical protein BF49_6564 [Bradyrhizobium sp.]
MRRHHWVAGAIDIMKTDTQSHLPVDDGLDAASTIYAPLFVD